MVGRRLFVTVGTTKFEKLIDTVASDDVLEKLINLGFTEVQFQIGNGQHEPKEHSKITLKYNKFFENFIDEIVESDLIISHAGAGTCLDVLKCEKPLIVVNNDELMDNHQQELGEELATNNYAVYCECDTLIDALDRDFNELKKYPKPNRLIFSDYLNKCMGFEQ